MKLKKISFKNFKSYSNAMTEILFDDTSSFNLILGENGTGKTSIAECATYLLYGKLENFNAADIPNDINKNFYGKIEVECDGHYIVIERGLNPSLFKVQIDNNVIDTAGKNSVQAMLEEAYYKIPYSVFNNIIIIEVGIAKSLLDMNVSDKRNIIDKICGFAIYNKYNMFVKDEMKALYDKIRTNEADLRATISLIENYDKQIEDLSNNETNQEEIDALKAKLNEALKLKKENDTKLGKIRDAGYKIKETSGEKSGELNIIKEKIIQIDKKIKLIDGGKCPTCGSSLTTDDFLKERDELVAQRAEYIKQGRLINEMMGKFKAQLSLLAKKEQEITSDNNSLAIENIKSDFMYKTTMRDKNTSQIEELKKKVSKRFEELNDIKESLDKEKTLMDFISMAFSDGGVKRFIANKYIPIINGLMENMLNYMNLNYRVEFDDSFNVTIMRNGIVKKYSTLSRGEKGRVDFAAIIAFIKFLKLQFGELNLLFLDELFSHIDINGMTDMVEILKGLCAEMNLNVYLIHHAQLEGVMFDHILKTTKTDGFSHIEFS